MTVYIEKPKPEIAVAVVVTMNAVGSVSMTAELTRFAEELGGEGRQKAK